MKKLISIWIASFMFACLVLAATDGEPNNTTIDLKSKKEQPVTEPMQQWNDKPVPAKITPESNPEIPVKVEVNIGKPLEVELELKRNDGLTVKGQGQTGEWFPIKVERTFENRLATYGALAAAIGALAGAVGAWRSANRTMLAAEGRLFFDLIKEYSSPKMLKDLSTVFDWYRKNEIEANDEQYAANKAEEWVRKIYNEKDPNAIKMNEARRHITHYFLNILSLQESGYVKKGLAEKICQDIGTKVLDVVFPLQKALRKHLDKLDGVPHDKTRQKIRELRDKFDRLLQLSSGARYRK